MSHFAYIGGSLGAWATGTTITAAKLWQLDQNQYAALNGDAGGTWAPTAKIVIGGANGLELSSSPLLLSGTAALTVSGSAQFNGSFAALGNSIIGTNSLNTLAVNAASSFNADATFGYVNATSNVVIGTNSTNTLTVNSSASFLNNCTIGSSATDYCEINANLNIVNGCTIGSSDVDSLDINATEAHYGPETHDGGETHNGAVSFESTVSMNGTVNIGNSSSDSVDLKSVIHSSTLEGRIIDGTVYPTDADWTFGSYRKKFIYKASVLTAARDITISFSGAHTGDEIEIWNMSTTVDLTVRNSGGTSLGVVGGAGSISRMAKLNWDGAAWVFLRP